MLILAGVSISAIVGEDGIVSKSKEATILTGMAAVEEWLQSQYIEYYDDQDDFVNKIELLNKKINNLLLKDGNMNYIMNNGKMYYLLNKNSLPSDLKQVLKGGDTVEYSKYIRLQDVYGITKDLKLFYCNEGEILYGNNVTVDFVDPNQPLVNVNKNNEVKSVIKEILAEIGIPVDPEAPITVGDVSFLKTLTLNGNNINLKDLNNISELKGLKTLIIENMELDSLNGIESLNLLEYVCFKNCIIKDYEALGSVYGLNRLCIYLPKTISEQNANTQILKLGEAFATESSKNINNLEYLSIIGDMYPYENNFALVGKKGDRCQNYWYNNNNSNLTDLSGLSSFNDNIKKSIKFLNLYENKLNSFESLSEFDNLVQVVAYSNRNVTNLSGLENKDKLTHLMVQDCGLTDIDALINNINLQYLSVNKNSNLTNLNGVSGLKKLYRIDAYECNIINLVGLKNMSSLDFLDLEKNVNLVDVSSLSNCTGLKTLLLGGNNNLDATILSNSLGNTTTHILQNCDYNYSLPSKYLKYLNNLTSYDYRDLNLNDSSRELEILLNNTKVTRLHLGNNNLISNDKLQTVLSSMSSLEFLSLYNTKIENLNFLNSVSNLVELDLRNCNYLATDLSILNEKALKMQTLILNNNNVDLTKIQTAINNISELAFEEKVLKKSWIHQSADYIRGIVTQGEFDFSKCTEIENFYCNPYKIGTNSNVDLSNCHRLNKLKFMYTYNTVSLSDSAIFFYGADVSVDLSNASSLEELYLDWWTGNEDADGVLEREYNSVKNAITSLPKVNQLKKLVLNRVHFSDYSFFTNKNFPNLNSLTINASNHVNREMGIENLNAFPSIPSLTYLSITYTALNDINAITKFPNLVEVDFSNNTQLTNLNGIESCINLAKLTAMKCKINSIPTLTNLSNLNTIKLQSNMISSINFLNNLKKVNILELNANYITDCTPLETLIENNHILFSELNLSNNSISRNTIDGKSNISIFVKLHNAGLQKLELISNNFFVGQVEELEETFGENVKIFAESN